MADLMDAIQYAKIIYEFITTHQAIKAGVAKHD
jgi:hypothetical protein